MPFPLGFSGAGLLALRGCSAKSIARMSGILTKMRNASARNGIRVHFIACTIILAMAVLFLLPALDNGFPFVFADSGTYLGGGGLTNISESRRVDLYTMLGSLEHLTCRFWPSRRRVRRRAT